MLENRFDKRVSLENWTKNYKTGQFEQVTKIKPATFMKGKAHIEIFDKDGNLEQEAVTENVINNNVNRFFSKHLFTDIIYGQSGIKRMYNDIIFGRLILNNYTTAEDSTLEYFPNMLTYPTIGWAHRVSDYAGGDLLRGDFNATESYVDIDSTPGQANIVLIYDWNTDQANGTFQSIFWMKDSYSISSSSIDDVVVSLYSDSARYSYTSAFYGKGFSESGRPVFAHAGKVYQFDEPYVHTSYGVASFTVSELFDYSTEASITNARDGIYKDSSGNYYVLAVSDNTIYKYNSSFVYQSSSSFTLLTYANDEGLLECDGANLFTVKRISATEINLYKFSLTGTLSNTYNIYTDLGFDFLPQSIMYDGTNIVLEDSSNKHVAIYNSSGVIQTYLKGVVSNNGNDELGTTIDQTFKNVISGSDGSNASTYDYNVAPSAHTLLASPVTKTSANTMKITYTFSFDLTAL